MSGILKTFSAGARVLAATVMLGALVVGTQPAMAQTSGGGKGAASREITISGSKGKSAAKTVKPAASATSGAATSLLKVRPRETTRDPFRNPVTGRYSAPPPRPTSTVSGSPKPPKPGPEASGSQAPKIPPPAVTVSGIIQAPSGPQAILTSPHQSYIVKVGDKLAAYKVTAIGHRSVSFNIQDQTFKLEMPDEFGLNAKSGK